MRWISEHHLDGYVVNCERRPGPGYLKLHRARCYTIGGTGNPPARGRRWIGDWIKVCATDRTELDRWARDSVGGELDSCPLCQP